jgi:uncharacterized OB-fold protein
VSEQPYLKPIPVPTPETQVFWDKAREHELWIQRCNACDHAYFYPRSECPHCLSSDVAWIHASGRGTLYSYMINHRLPPGFREEGPYAIAIVELDEGPRMMSNIVGIANTPENLVLDMPLEVVFEDITDEISLPKWRPAQRAEQGV